MGLKNTFLASLLLGNKVLSSCLSLGIISLTGSDQSIDQDFTPFDTFTQFIYFPFLDLTGPRIVTVCHGSLAHLYLVLEIFLVVLFMKFGKNVQTIR